MKYDWFDMSLEGPEKWKKISPPNEFCIYSNNEIHHILSRVLPDALINNYDSTFIVDSATQDGTFY